MILPRLLLCTLSSPIIREANYHYLAVRPGQYELIKSWIVTHVRILIMVDCSLLRDTNKLLVFERNRLLLEAKNLDYSIEM